MIGHTVQCVTSFIWLCNTIHNIIMQLPTHVHSYPPQSLINHLQYITTSYITGEISGKVGTVHA